ncbi:MAG TPA: hypothetical protein VGC53_11490, partial [Vicinamibacteria bacterium]|jgi:hypothetical protein
VALKLYDAVRIVRLLKANRYHDGTVGVRRPPQVGDLGTIVHEYDREDPRAPLMVEKSDPDGHTVWLADFEPDELELVETFT